MTVVDVSQNVVEVAWSPDSKTVKETQDVVEIPFTDAIRRIDISQNLVEVPFTDAIKRVDLSQTLLEIAWTPGSPEDIPCVVTVPTPQSVASAYYVLLRDTNGTKVALFDDWLSLEYGVIVNDVGYYAIEFVDNDDSRFDLFQTDYILEVYRSIPGLDVSWYREFSGRHRKEDRDIGKDGRKTFISTGYGHNDFLAATVIGYLAGTIDADKQDAAETVMKEYVDYNCGPNATVANGREIDGVLPRFTVEADGGAGKEWAGSKAFENLLDVLQEISNFSGIDFQVVPTIPGYFQFRTYEDQLGSDRTTQDLNTATGRNTAGNVPVIISIPMGTLQELHYENDRQGERNIVYVLGPGEGATRDITVRSDPDSIDDSPWNRREISKGATNLEFQYQREDFGDAIIEELKRVQAFSFVPLQQPSMAYGKHYFLGDKISIEFRGQTFHKRLVSIRNRIADNTEQISMEFADISEFSRD